MTEDYEKSFEWRVCCSLYKKYYLAYSNYRYDLIMGAFVRLHELKLNCDFVSDKGKYLKFLWSKAHSFMSNFIYKIRHRRFLSQPINLSNNSTRTIEDYLPDLKFNIDYRIDLKYLIDKINFIYNSFSQQDKKILKDYFVKKISFNKLIGLYSINRNYLYNVINSFKLQLKDVLLKEEYIVGKNNYVDYLSKLRDKKMTLKKEARDKFYLKTKLKNGDIDFVEFAKKLKTKTVFINLILNNVDKFELFAKILKIDLSIFKNKLLKQNIGFKLYEINSIRKQCFPQYKMCDMVVYC